MGGEGRGSERDQLRGAVAGMFYSVFLFVCGIRRFVPMWRDALMKCIPTMHACFFLTRVTAVLYTCMVSE